MKPVYTLLLLLVTAFSLSCSDKDDSDDDHIIPDPGKNVAGYVAGTYRVTAVLSGTTGASTLTPGIINGSGTLTITTVDDNTALYRNNTELTVVATGKKITLNEEVKNSTVTFSSGNIRLGQPISSGSILSLATMSYKNRLYVSRTKQDGYDVTIEYTR